MMKSYIFLIPLIVIGCGGVERREINEVADQVVYLNGVPMIVTSFYIYEVRTMNKGAEQWQEWERQRRFTITKCDNPLTGLYTLVIRDLWQKRVAEYHGLAEEDYENLRQGLMAQIAQGRIPVVEWRNYGQVPRIVPEQKVLEFSRNAVGESMFP